LGFKPVALVSTFKAFKGNRFNFNTLLKSPYTEGFNSMRKNSRLRFFNSNYTLRSYLVLSYPDTPKFSLPNLRLYTNLYRLQSFNFFYVDSLVSFISPLKSLELLNLYPKNFQNYAFNVFFLRSVFRHSKVSPLKSKPFISSYRTLGEKLYFYSNPRFLGNKPKISQFRFLIPIQKQNWGFKSNSFRFLLKLQDSKTLFTFKESKSKSLISPKSWGEVLKRRLVKFWKLGIVEYPPYNPLEGVFQLKVFSKNIPLDSLFSYFIFDYTRVISSNIFKFPKFNFLGFRLRASNFTKPSNKSQVILNKPLSSFSKQML